MTLKLNSSSSGSVSFVAPASTTAGADINLALPVDGGTVDRLERAGNILQVKQAVKTDRASATGYNWTDTGLSVDITPTSTTSNILVMANIHLGGGAAYDMKLKIVRDTTDIGLGDGDGSRPAVTSVLNVWDAEAVDRNYKMAPVGISYLDTSVSTTAPVTYKVQFASYGTFVLYVNRSETYAVNTPTNDYDSTPISTLTLMEVAG